MTRTTLTMERVVALGMALVLVGGFAGVGSVVGAVQETTTQNGQEETVEVRAAHMAPDAPAVDVQLDGETVLENVSFGAVSDYLDVPAGEHQVTVTVAGNESQVVFDGNISVEADTGYTLAAVGEVAENGTEAFDVVAFSDTPDVPTGDDAAVRLVHVSPDAGPVDVTVEETGDVLYDNVTFANATSYVNVPAGDYTLEIRQATEGNDGEVVTTVDVSLEANAAYSAFAAGYVSPDDAPADTPFQLITAVDASEEPVTETTTPAAVTETTPEEPMTETTPGVATNETTTVEM